MNNPLLSIIIPTYNRDKFLRSTLMSIIKQIDELENIEIIVSDNASTDTTPNLMQEFSAHKKIKSYRQPCNLGFAGNVVQSMKYATGEFCWVIGDDDFINQGAIDALLLTLKENPNIDFYFTKLGLMHLNEYSKLRNFDTSLLADQISTLDIKILNKWEELLLPPYSAVFLGELMASIFRRKIWNNYTLTDFDAPYLSTLNTSYPHSVVFAHTFITKNAAYINMPIITVLEGNRDWWHKVGYVVIVHLRSLLNLYEQQGVLLSTMKMAYNHYISISFDYAIKFLNDPQNELHKYVNLKNYFGDILKLNRALVLTKVKANKKLMIKGIIKTTLYKLRILK